MPGSKPTIVGCCSNSFKLSENCGRTRVIALKRAIQLKRFYQAMPLCVRVVAMHSITAGYLRRVKRFMSQRSVLRMGSGKYCTVRWLGWVLRVVSTHNRALPTSSLACSQSGAQHVLFSIASWCPNERPGLSFALLVKP